MNATANHIDIAPQNCDEKSPFLLENEGAYQAWRKRKLAIREQLRPDRVFELDSDARLPESILPQAAKQVDAYNFVLFQSSATIDKQQFLSLNRQFGLERIDANLGADDDSVTSLRVVGSGDERAMYIPYTNRALNWHTDGYYNPRDRRINAFALYCVHQAGRGGGNHLFDHELMYILLRDRTPDLLAVLMDNDMMSIPPNIQGNRVIREAEAGPVFSIKPGGCQLQMRYTSRPHNIVWKPGKRSEKALNRLREILMDGEAVIDLRLEDNQGIVCNNVLHGRQAFHEPAGRPGRLIYRARYYDAIDFDRGHEREAGSE